MNILMNRIINLHIQKIKKKIKIKLIMRDYLCLIELIKKFKIIKNNIPKFIILYHKTMIKIKNIFNSPILIELKYKDPPLQIILD